MTRINNVRFKQDFPADLPWAVVVIEGGHRHWATFSYSDYQRRWERVH